MKVIDCDQGSAEWFGHRARIPTASQFGKILSPTGKPSTQAAGYMDELLAMEMGAEMPDVDTFWTARGTDMESEARSWYSFETGREVEQVGFVVGEGAGCSPDGLCGERGLEIKAPKPGNHVGYLLKGKLPTTYIPQVQGSMWVCGLDAWDFVSYCPGLPPLLITVERDEGYISQLAERVEWFNAKLAEKRAKMVELGYLEA